MNTEETRQNPPPLWRGSADWQRITIKLQQQQQKKKRKLKNFPLLQIREGFRAPLWYGIVFSCHLHPNRGHGGEDDTYVSNGGGPHITNGHRRHQQNGRRCLSQIKNTPIPEDFCQSCTRCCRLMRETEPFHLRKVASSRAVMHGERWTWSSPAFSSQLPDTVDTNSSKEPYFAYFELLNVFFVAA